ncbi:phosphopantetheine-binding protein [Streptomyces sp. NPDC052301]|uniref:phosphopantetheine-binding protein n=1 Tax=Streptomyces sp. NPDC052301 TaxID=3365687 RepID=UPI0037D47C39
MRDRVTPDGDGLVARLCAGLSHTGTTLYGSCVQQAVSNVLEAQGLRGAADLLGMSWGFGYRSGDVRLRAGERWPAAVARLSGLVITRLRPGSAQAAADAEHAALADGVPAVVAVDSYDIASPYQGTTHLMHALILVARDADGVTVLDPMNQPAPTRLPLEVYQRSRSSSVVAGHDLIVSRGSVDRACSPLEAVGELYADATAHREAGLEEFDRFVLDVEAGRVAPDVADVAAERSYAQRLVAAAAAERPELRSLADAMDSLARRWYFAHTVGMESGEDGGRRMPKILRALRNREVQMLDEFDETVRAAGLAPAAGAGAGSTDGTAVPDGLDALIRSVLERQTKIETAGLQSTDDLWAAGLTSLESVRMMMDIEDELGLEFPPSLLSRTTFESLSAIERAVVAVLSGTADEIATPEGANR